MGYPIARFNRAVDAAAAAALLTDDQVDILTELVLGPVDVRDLAVWATTKGHALRSVQETIARARDIGLHNLIPPGQPTLRARAVGLLP